MPCLGFCNFDVPKITLKCSKDSQKMSPVSPIWHNMSPGCPNMSPRYLQYVPKMPKIFPQYVSMMSQRWLKGTQNVLNVQGCLQDVPGCPQDVPNMSHMSKGCPKYIQNMSPWELNTTKLKLTKEYTHGNIKGRNFNIVEHCRLFCILSLTDPV